MKLARKIDRGLLVAAAFSLALPALAQANPLLSGYGGPGQGSQALLGATLTGPRGGGGGGGEGTSSGSIEAHGPSVAVTAPPGTQTAAGQKSTYSPAKKHTTAGGGSSSAGSTQTQIAFAPARSVHTDTAGLSGGDLALILLGIGVVAATGFLMARLAGGSGKGGQLKP